MKLDVLLGVPKQYQKNLDLKAIRQCFPYGKVHIQCPSDGGGLVASSGKVIAEMGDTNDDMIIVCVAVTVGYWLYLPVETFRVSFEKKRYKILEIIGCDSV